MFVTFYYCDKMLYVNASYRRKRFLGMRGSLWFQVGKSLSCQGSMIASGSHGGRSINLRVYMSKHMHEAERGNLEWHKAFNFKDHP